MTSQMPATLGASDTVSRMASPGKRPSMGPGTAGLFCVRTVHDPVLRQPADSVEIFDRNLGQLVETMFAVMEQAGGVGLAAPQIGVGRRVFVMRHGGIELAVVNPSVELLGHTETAEEGCLSLPGQPHRVARWSNIRLNGRAVDGSTLDVSLAGWAARIVQHELDHLDGVLIDSRAKL
jgi:peptide deformylase